MYGAQYASVERIDHLSAELQKVVSNRVAWEMKSVQFLASVLDPASNVNQHLIARLLSGFGKRCLRTNSHHLNERLLR